MNEVAEFVYLLEVLRHWLDSLCYEMVVGFSFWTFQPRSSPTPISL